MGKLRHGRTINFSMVVQLLMSKGGIWTQTFWLQSPNSEGQVPYEQIFSTLAVQLPLGFGFLKCPALEKWREYSTCSSSQVLYPLLFFPPPHFSPPTATSAIASYTRSQVIGMHSISLFYEMEPLSRSPAVVLGQMAYKACALNLFLVDAFLPDDFFQVTRDMFTSLVSL